MGGSEEEEKTTDSPFGDEPGTNPSKDPLQQHEREGAPRPEYEEEVKDLQKTGRWGSVSRREQYVILAIVVLIVLGGVIAVAVVFSGGSSSGPSPTPSPTQAPTSTPTTDEQQWAALQQIIKNNPLLNDTMELIDQPLSILEGQAENEEASPQLRAASWLVLSDERNEHHESQFLQWRYALATLYYALGGDDWTAADGWLTSADTCVWYGVSCNFPNDDKVVTLDLDSNNLVGEPVPKEITLLDALVSLFLAQNEIGGEFPALAVGSIPTLGYLYINDNKFTGQFSADIRANGVLHTLYIQENDFTGFFPVDLCAGPGEAYKLREFGLDCDKLSCFCCSSSGANTGSEIDPCF